MSDPFFNRPNPPVAPDARQEPAQPDLMLNKGWVRHFKTTVTLGAAALLVILVLFALTRETPEQQAAGPVTASPPAATEPGTTGRSNLTPQPSAPRSVPNAPSSGQFRPLPTEQDPVEQNTRP